jgi:hypothetical protein
MSKSTSHFCVSGPTCRLQACHPDQFSSGDLAVLQAICPFQSEGLVSGAVGLKRTVKPRQAQRGFRASIPGGDPRTPTTLYRRRSVADPALGFSSFRIVGRFRAGQRPQPRSSSIASLASAR